MNEQEMIAILKNPYADRSRVAQVREKIEYMDLNRISKDLFKAYMNHP